MSDVRPEAAEDRERSFDCLVISDLHLGSDVCQAKLIEEFLEWAVRHTRELVINGDIFDDLNFKRLSKRHFACLKSIRRHSDRDDLRLTWIRGNHDGAADVISHIVGVEFLDEYTFDNGQIRLLILHGDQFDHFITRYKWMTSIACGLFYYIQKWMPHSAARWIRRISKRFQRNSQVVRDGAVEYAQASGCDHVTCGHTHAPFEAFVDGIRYLNSGTWTEHPPCPFVAVSGDRVDLRYWPMDEPRPDPARVEGLASASTAGPVEG
ncbi:UDP-2,3-diacylglucosamine diphosphatase [Tautonia plasticadhaerens]|uniref:UDP-2,3-diacylglucosamine hydrolase n=1 Tax=Tautonia plasticadhaerens TaxID=2527974 RepID=A0A518GYJ9_9BACT|nr:UDP-2,3-diacylglucosamine diphosphatase [Tautonia plasticadhaerens]QDV33676.1 UDP-2,3-diacylglucosamine hydrolase [Tautonia plasticadhaerens]